MAADEKKRVRKPRSDKEKARARERMREWYAVNKGRALAQQKVYREEHAEQIKAVRKAYYEANKTGILAKQKEYIENNYERVSERWRNYSSRNSVAIQARVLAHITAHPERHRRYGKAWEARNPEAVRRKYQDRRARKRYNGGKLSPGLVPSLLEQQKGRCVYCPADITANYHLDHRVPLKRGGAHADHNMQLLCPSCNQRKGALDPVDFEKRLRRHKRFRAEWITREHFVSGQLSYQKLLTRTRSSAVT